MGEVRWSRGKGHLAKTKGACRSKCWGGAGKANLGRKSEGRGGEDGREASGGAR